MALCPRFHLIASELRQNLLILTKFEVSSASEGIEIALYSTCLQEEALDNFLGFVYHPMQNVDNKTMKMLSAGSVIRTARHAPKAPKHPDKKDMVTLRKALITFSLILLILITGTSPVVWMLTGSTRFREKIIEDLVEEALTTRVIHGAQSETDKGLALFQFVDNHISHHKRPPGSILSTPFLPYLLPGEALCDEQALALMDLATKAHIRASVIYLRGYDRISHHRVCQLYLDGAFRIFDPDYGYVFYRGDKIATFNEIQQRDRIRAEKMEAQKALNNRFDEHRYFRLYEPTFDCIGSNTNDKIHFGQKVRAGMVKLYYALFAERLVAYLEDLYFRISDIHPLLRARIEHLSGRFDIALQDYDLAIGQMDDPFLKAKALFFKGQLFGDMKNFFESAYAFEELLRLYPDHRNREERFFTWEAPTRA